MSLPVNPVISSLVAAWLTSVLIEFKPSFFRSKPSSLFPEIAWRILNVISPRYAPLTFISCAARDVRREDQANLAVASRIKSDDRL